MCDETLCVVYFLLFFFFSSRRRHTRFDCDWSSDVCSSDLRERLICRPQNRLSAGWGRPLLPWSPSCPPCAKRTGWRPNRPTSGGAILGASRSLLDRLLHRQECPWACLGPCRRSNSSWGALSPLQKPKVC